MNLAKLKKIIFSPKFFAAVLIVLGLITRFIFISNPAQVVFDEVHFGKFVSSYFTGNYYFDIHPPLGKMIIAAGAWFGGYGDYVGQNGVFGFKDIGGDYGPAPYVWFRFLPALAGSLIPLVVFLFMLEFFVPEGRDLSSRVRSGEGVSGVAAGKLASFLTGLLLIFENSLLVESRLILMDTFLILFGFLGLYFFFRARNNGYPFPLLMVSGLLFSLSILIKWTGLGFWGVAGLIYAWDFLNNWFSFFLPTRRFAPAANARLPAGRQGTVISADDPFGDQARQLPITKKKLNQLFLGILSLVVLPFVLYFVIFQIHFALLPNCPAKDEGNGCDFMSQEFRNNQLNPWQEFSELNQKMWSYNKGISASHEYGSKALGWPLMIRSVYYWVGAEQGRGADPELARPAEAFGVARVERVTTPRIYFLGNPINWFLGLFGIFSVWFLPLSREKKIIVGLLYLSSFLPFILVKRVLFLYHYLFALIVSVMAFSLVFAESIKKCSFRTQVFVVGCLLSVVSLVFLFFVPLSYGLPLSDQEFRARQWSSLWFSGNNQLKQICEKSGCSVLKWLVY